MTPLNLEPVLVPLISAIWYYFAMGVVVVCGGLGVYYVARGLWGLVCR